MKTRRALVTGITGFIGSALARRLVAEGWDVHGLVRPQSDVTPLSLAGPVNLHRVEDGQDLTPAVRAARPDVVFHLASLYVTGHRPEQVEPLIRSNVLFTVRLAQAMVDAHAHCLVNTGTAWQHFRGEPYSPVNLYAATKQAAEDLLHFYFAAHGLSVMTLRLFDTYGDGDRRRKLVQILIDAARSGERLPMSPGEQIVDLTHVDDVAAGFALAAQRLLTAVVPVQEGYLLSGERHSVRRLAGLVGEVLGQPVHAEFGGRPYRVREVMVPAIASPAMQLPGWQRRHGLRDYLAAHRA